MMQKKIEKILMITAFPPCQKTAGQDYTRRLLKDLIDRGYCVDLIYAEFPGHVPELPPQVRILKTIKRSKLNCFSNIKYHPIFTRRFDRGVLQFIRKIAPKYDLLYFDFSQVHIYSLYVKHTYKVLMSHDVLGQKFSRQSSKLNLDWIKRTERELLRSGTVIYTFSDKDSDLIKKFYGLKSTPVNFYLKTGKFDYTNVHLSDSFSFYGAWNREENVEALMFFVEKVIPLVKKDIHFDVVGGGMGEELKNKISQLHNFRVLGFVDDPVKTISETQALIAPLHYGAGVKVKVVDALTSGTPVVGTHVTFEGLQDNKATRLFYLAEKPEEYAAIINNWQKDAADYKQQSANEFYERYNTNHFPDYLK